MTARRSAGIRHDDLETQAWNWLRLLTSGAATEDDAEDFRHWLQAGAPHRQAYANVKQQWDAVTSSARTWRYSHPGIASVPPRARPPMAGRRLFLGSALGAAAAAGVAIAFPPMGLWPAPSEWGADDRTATGEQRTIALGDQVDVMLNTQTSIRRESGHGAAAGFELVGGEAAIDLRRAAHPFTVVAGAGSSSAHSGQFEVRYLEGRVCVTCIEGMVRIRHHAGGRMLQANEQAVYDARTISGTAGIDPAMVTAWRKGMLILHDMRLADAIDEINRYRAGRVILMNGSVRDRRMNGSFPIASLDQALWQMQRVFGLHARPLVGGYLILS